MEIKRENKVCESCGQTFGCGAKLDGCWCTELTLTETQAGNLKANFTDCLCPQCLEKYAVKAAIKITYPDTDYA